MTSKALLSPAALNLARGAASPAVAGLQAYLSQFGWLRTPDQQAIVAEHDELPLVEPGRFDEATESALAEFQRFHGLAVTGRLDASTLELMRKPRCGMPDKTPAPRGDGALNEFLAAATKWDHQHLGFNLSKGTVDLSNASVIDALRLAYRNWCLVSQMEVHSAGAGAEIDVKFVTGDHGDGFSFDGAGPLLGHGFYPPPNGGAIAGDLHFDDAETWTRNLPPSGTDLDTVALHEAGHTLGLDHSSDTSAVMYAYYNGPRRSLTADDIAGIRSLYGTRNRNAWSNIDAAVDGQAAFAGKAYFFRGSQYLRYDYGDDLPDPGFAKPIAGDWPAMPAAFTSGIEATLNGQAQFAGKLYLFKGGQYVSYDWANDKADAGYPKPVAGNWPGLPATFASGVDAAVSGQKQFAGKAYFFKGSQYVRYDWAANKMDTGFPRSIAADWPSLPAAFTSGIQAALNGQEGSDGKLYLFKGTDYVRYDWAADKADVGFPRPIAVNWL